MIKRRDKRGSEKYYIIISLIIGIMILSLSLYFIFNEYFTEDILNMEACRQSIVLRNTLPEGESIAGIGVLDKFKSRYPLKCKNEVREIKLVSPKLPSIVKSNEMDFADIRKLHTEMKLFNELVMKEVADSFLQCWVLVGKGEYSIYPKNMILEKSSCLICSRITFSNEIEEYYNSEYYQSNGFLYAPFSLFDYMENHDLKGNPTENSRENYHSQFSNLAFGDSFVFLTEDNVEKYYGMRDIIDPLAGDILVGYYEYSNLNIFQTSEIARYVFYIQPELDGGELAKCDIESIPA